MTISEEKAAARKAAFVRRGAAHGTVDPGPAQDRLVAHVRRIPTLEIVSAYAPIRTEIDPLPAVERLHALGYRICLPVVPGRDQPLLFREWWPGCPMEEGAFGARIPATSVHLEPECLITPLLAFDRAGVRLGYGGGFYDRTLALMRPRRRTYAIGFAYEAQAVDLLPVEPTDQPFDGVVTEAGTHYPC